MKIRQFLIGVFALAFTFVLLASTGNMWLASSVTIGLGAFSALMHTSKTFEGLALEVIIPTVPDFTAKTDEEIKALDPDALLAYRKAEKEFEVANMRKEFLTEIKRLEDGGADSGAIKSLTDKLETISKEHIKWAEEITALKEKGDKTVATHGERLNKWIADNEDKIRELKNAGSGLITFKAPEPITSASTPTNPDGIPEIVGVQQAAPGNVNLRSAFVMELVTRFATNQKAYAYTDTVPKDGDYSFVAESGTKPQIDFVIETRYAEPVKAAAHMVLTDEAVTDIPGLQSIANDYLRKKHDLKKQNGILFGDGVAPNPEGATVYARTFVAGAMADSLAGTNFMDVVNACITDIYTTHNFVDEEAYMANLVMINPVDFFIQLVGAKDLNGLPLFPTASLFNRVTLGGVTIIPERSIPAGKIFCADMSKYNVTDYVDYEIRIGWINDQFIKNQFSIVGESRFHAFVKKLDEQAFIYDDIATIQAAIDSTLP